ncbi:MAG: alpha/beta hydrolase, partial [Caulobacter sp. 39-67-4]
MSHSSWIVAAGALAMLTLGGCAHAAAPEFKPAACVGDYSAVSQKVDCGNLIVDEARGKAGSRRISIAVAIVRASTPKVGLPPVIYLHGGPGGAAVASVPRLLQRPAARDYIGIDQDWIFIDQRGGGLSDPSLDCPGANLTDVGPPSDQDADAIVACLQAFKAKGVDLSRYNAVEV